MPKAPSLDRLIERRRRCRIEIRKRFEEIRRLDGAISQMVCREISEGKLTMRERQIIDLIMQEKGNKEIAEILHITVRTVKFHVSRLLVKFHVSSRHELAAVAFKAE